MNFNKQFFVSILSSLILISCEESSSISGVSFIKDINSLEMSGLNGKVKTKTKEVLYVEGEKFGELVLEKGYYSSIFYDDSGKSYKYIFNDGKGESSSYEYVYENGKKVKYISQDNNSKKEILYFYKNDIVQYTLNPKTKDSSVYHYNYEKQQEIIDNYLKNNLKSKIVNTYKNGFLIHSIIYDGEGLKEYETEYLENSDKVILRINYEDGDRSSLSEYKYDRKGRLIEDNRYEYSYSSKSLSISNKYDYSNEEEVILKEYFSSSDRTSEYVLYRKFDEYDNIIEEKKYDKSDEEFDSITKTYITYF